MKNTNILSELYKGLIGVKSWLSRGFVLILALFTLGVGQMWGWNSWDKKTIYFDNSYWAADGYTPQLLIGRYYKWSNDSRGSSAETMTNISGTDLWYLSSYSYSNYTSEYFISNASTWGNEYGCESDGCDNTPEHRYTYATHYTNSYNTNGDADYNLFVPASASNGANLSYTSNARYSTLLNSTQTIYQCVAENGGTPAKSTAAIGTISIATKYLSAATTASDHNVSISSGSNSCNTTAARTATVTMTATSIADGYSFLGWYDSETGGTRLESSTTYTYQATAAKTVYARFSHETTHSVAITYTCASPSATVSAATNQAIGQVTSSAITAPTVAGYTFENWTLGSGVQDQGSDLTANPISVKTLSSGTYTMQANYTEDLTSTYVLKGAFDSWGSGLSMSKKTGHSTEDWVYCTRSFTESGTTALKIHDGSTTWYGAQNADNSLEKTVGSLTVSGWILTSSGGGNDIYFKHYISGTYEFAYNTSTKEFRVTWPDVNQVYISAASPTDATNTNAFDLSSAVSNVRSKTLTLNANTTYTFKIIYGSDWYGNGGALTRSTSTSSNTLTDLSTSGGNMTLTTDYAGSYTFKFNQSTKTLSVDFPEAYQIHFERGAINGGKVNSYPIAKQVETNTDVTSDVTWVKAGNTVTLTAAEVKDGGHYVFYGWYTVQNPDRANPSTNRLGTSLAYTTPAIASASNKNFYAVYFETAYWVNLSVNGQGSVSPDGGQNAYIETPSGDFTATPSTGYKFDNWTIPANVTAASTYTSSSNPIRVNATADATLQANFSPRYAVRVKTGGGDWSAESANHLTGYTKVDSKDVGYCTITLAANTTYEVQIYDRQSPNAWYGGTEAQNIHYADGDYEFTIATTSSPKSVFVHSAAAGEYTFKWNLTDKKIAVHYPTSLFITSGQKTEGQSDEVGGSFTAVDNGSRDVKGGKFVADGASVTFSASPNTGYDFDGWYTNAECTEGKDATNPMTVSSITTDKTIYAKFVPKTYTITLTREGTGYGSGGDATATASYNTVLPSATMPTAAAGYHFMGYFTEAAGAGTKFIDENGAWIAGIESYTDAGKKWIQDGGIELFAYFKKAEITGIDLNATVFDPVTEGEGWVIANPTIEPTPAPTTIICWELLYDNNNPVGGHNVVKDPDGSHPNRVKFSITGLAAGGYKIRATLAKNETCPPASGDILDTREVSFSIASGFTVTIQYKDASGNTIASSTTTPGKATDWTSVSAPEIFGYTFSTWVPGDGITLESSATTNSNRFEATFNGTLTAQYTKNKMVFLKNTIGWSAPYVYFYKEGGYWDASNGAGCNGDACLNRNYARAMTNIPGTDIWYFDYGGTGFANQVTRFMAFTDGDKSNHEHFNGVDVIYVTSYTHGFNEGTPMFVTLAKEDQNRDAVGGASYYSRGYWTNYLGANTGYTIVVYNSDGTTELKRQRLTSIHNDQLMTMKATLDLDASAIYKYALIRDNNISYGNTGTMTYAARTQNWAFTQGTEKCTLKTTAAGKYVFTLSYAMDGEDKTTYQLRINVEYPAAVNDFQILYNDNAQWSLGSAHDENWVHPSRVIRARAGGVDTISFFVAKGEGISAQLKARKVNSIDAGTGAITWGSLNINKKDASQSLTVDSAAVWNFKVTQGTTAGTIASIENIGAYTGNYYIRCNALNSNWDNYTTDGDHRMTYSSFSESNANSFGEKYSHYKAKWCPRNTNIAFCIANDYSPCITDTLIQDVPNTYENTESDGTLKYEKDGGNMKYNDANAYLDRYSANVRFMWNRKTNKISRAYISAATSGLAQFLVLRAGQELHNDDNTAISSTPANSVLLHDNENWIYEAKLMIKPGTRFKLYACYAKSPVDPASAQYFRGAYNGDNFTSDENSVILIGGESENYQLARVVYDFKTNRLLAAWMPSGSDISTKIDINADVMVIREHQESATCITFADNAAKLGGVKTVYGVMKFNRWILNNRGNSASSNPNLASHAPLPVDQQKSTYERRLYFISFPFNVRVGDIFGFGQYGSYWVLQYYDGLSRAKNGYWLDSKSNWKYISPTQVANGYTLEANQGYLLELNLSAMAADNTTFWSNGISTIELYFPSTVNQDTLKRTNITIPALGDEYKCNINRGTAEGDRRVKDSYWRCIGVPSYNLYNSALTDGSGNEIRWKTDYTWSADESEFPFIYMWNKTDNTLTPQSTSRFLFQPMHAYLTQIKSAIVWSAVSAKPSSIVARRARKEANNEHEWRIELRQDTTFLDQTYVRMTNLEQVTDSFDFGQDLVKELNSRSNIYTYIGYEKVAANSMTVHTDQTTVIPVGANIRADGEYTFSMPEGTNGVGITLIDTEANVRTSLSALDYTVTLSAGEYTNRFFLEISPVQNTPTDLGNVQGDNVQGTKARKVMVDGILYIVRDGKMYDARGARVE